MNPSSPPVVDSNIKYIDATSREIISLRPENLELCLRDLESAAKTPGYGSALPWLVAIGLLVAEGIRMLVSGQSTWAVGLLVAAAIPGVPFIYYLWQAWDLRKERQVTIYDIMGAMLDQDEEDDEAEKPVTHKALASEAFKLLDSMGAPMTRSQMLNTLESQDVLIPGSDRIHKLRFITSSLSRDHRFRRNVPARGHWSLAKWERRPLGLVESVLRILGLN